MTEASASSAQIATQQPSATSGIQVQVIPAQTQSAVSNSANPSSLLASSGDVSAQVTQLTGLRLPTATDQQQRLLLAQLQQLSKTNTSIPANASFVLQPTFQGITVVTSAPSTTTSSDEASKG